MYQSRAKNNLLIAPWVLTVSTVYHQLKYTLVDCLFIFYRFEDLMTHACAVSLVKSSYLRRVQKDRRGPDIGDRILKSSSIKTLIEQVDWWRSACAVPIFPPVTLDYLFARLSLEVGLWLSAVFSQLRRLNCGCPKGWNIRIKAITTDVSVSSSWKLSLYP